MSETPGKPNGPSGGSSGGRGPIDPDAAMSAPTPPAAFPAYSPYPPPAPKRGGAVSKFFVGLFLSLFLLSVISNIYMSQIIAFLTAGPHESVYEDGDEKQRIVIIPVEGLIDEAKRDFVAGSLKSLSKNKENLPKAVILRVDSPGGYVGPSDRILHAIKQFKEDNPGIPVVASFGSVAASGGYYVSASCDKIIAEPTCVTGSIGVLVTAFTVQELLAKVGVNAEILVADGSPKKDIANNMFRDLNDADRAKIKEILNNAHRRFVQIVHEGRKNHLSEEQVTALANGDTYSTEEAIANKLIDGEGYLDAAIDEAKSLAKITDDPQVTVIREPRGFSPLSLLGKATQDAPAPTADQARTWLREMTSPRLEYLWQPGM